MESAIALTTESGRKETSATKAIHFPSGDTTGLRCEYAVLVSCTRLAPGTCVKSCCGRITRASRGPGMKPCPFAL